MTRATSIARAQAYPARPVRLLVGFPPGGTATIGARLIAQWLSDHLGQQFIVENRPGAATNIAAQAVISSPADGYTLLYAGANNVINASVYENVSFDFARDITMVAGVVKTPLVLEVNPTVPANSVAELIAYAKANPGKLSLASYGTGTISHVTGELFKMQAGIEMIHVPYRGGAPMVADLLGGQITAGLDALPSSIEHIRAGKLRALAVTTIARSQALPNVPAVSEFLPGFEATAWNGIGVPRSTPPEIVEKLNREINAALADPTINKRFSDLGGIPFVSSPAELAKFIIEQTDAWAKVVKAANIKPE